MHQNSVESLRASVEARLKKTVFLDYQIAHDAASSKPFCAALEIPELNILRTKGEWCKTKNLAKLSCASTVLQKVKALSGRKRTSLPIELGGFDKYLKRNEKDPSRVGMTRLTELLNLLKPHFGELKPKLSSVTAELNKPHYTLLGLPLNIGEVRSTRATAKAGKQEAAMRAAYLIEKQIKAGTLALALTTDSSDPLDSDSMDPMSADMAPSRKRRGYPIEAPDSKRPALTPSPGKAGTQYLGMKQHLAPRVNHSPKPPDDAMPERDLQFSSSGSKKPASPKQHVETILLLDSDEAAERPSEPSSAPSVPTKKCAPALMKIRDIPCFTNGAGDWMPQEVYDPTVIAELTRKIEEQVALGLSVGSAAFQEVGMVLNDIFLGGTAQPVRRPRSSSSAFGEVRREGFRERHPSARSVRSDASYQHPNDYWKNHPPRAPPPRYSPPRGGFWSMPSEPEKETFPECEIIPAFDSGERHSISQCTPVVKRHAGQRDPRRVNDGTRRDRDYNGSRRERPRTYPVEPSQGFGGEPYRDPCRTYMKEEPGQPPHMLRS